ncbi:MAG TPA: metalloregulator ArsR/SmtB family transcription factor [Burkholderiales bacterium]|jgi:DNA-binding transcriptional ArsR family regulator|nr:metalloregulator ArsR/SmtB family transcription factor [Burkholderiales bacterium]
METKQAVESLGALAQDTRLAIFRLLVQAGAQGRAAGQIGEALDLPPATLSFHLAGLARAGLAQSRQEGRFVIYTANFESMAALVAFLTENCCGGAACAPASCQPATTTGKTDEAPSRPRRRA